MRTTRITDGTRITIDDYQVTIAARKGSNGVRWGWYCSAIGLGGEGTKATPELAVIDAQQALGAAECGHGIPATQFCHTCHDQGDTTATPAAAPKPAVSADQIVRHLRNTGHSAREIAAAIGVHVSTVYRWARGMFRPTAARFAALTALI